MYKFFLKRIIDFTAALIVVILASPLMMIIALIIKIQQGGQVFYIQERPGFKGKIFKAIKFKTMSDKKDRKGNLLPDGDRITRIGKFFRSSSLDEIPQLFNIIKGDMSLIGPRPLLVKYLPLYTGFQNRRHEVRPGLTGWAQVNGRNNISWLKKFELDVWYVDNLSFSLDLKIVLMTIQKVILKEGISKKGTATSDAFNGNN